MEAVTVKAAEVMVTGMTRAELLVTIAAALAILSLTIYVLNFILNLRLAGFVEMKEDVKVIRNRVKSSEDIASIAREEVHKHEVSFHSK